MRAGGGAGDSAAAPRASRGRNRTSMPVNDMQAGLGQPVEPQRLARGDLVFWKGHVGVMLDSERLLHANAHHMACAVEPLAQAVSRIGAGDAGPPTGFRRLD